MKYNEQQLWRYVQAWGNEALKTDPEAGAVLRQLESIFKKANAYTKYNEAVENGKIVILNKLEIVELLSKFGIKTAKKIREYLESVSNWKGLVN